MAAKLKNVFRCRVCGTEHFKWQGQCKSCGGWNTLQEETTTTDVGGRASARGGPHVPTPIEEIPTETEARIPMPDGEFNRVLDGGAVVGSLILIGGEPGVGKSTLLLQLALQLAPRRILYVSGEESERQIKMRAERLLFRNENLYLVSETSLSLILKFVDDLEPDLLIVDSIQTIYYEGLEASPGTPAQVRECATRLMRFVKERAVTTILVGHITKEGVLAGPKVLEHIVDVVLEFEGDRHYNFRILRSAKNRFGATPQLGVYEIENDGMKEVENPSRLFLSESATDFSGVGIAATLQGARPLLIETQALVSDSNYGTPQRSATGLDARRMNLLLAVLEKKCGFKMGTKDVFLNLAGGIKNEDPALDLSLACAIVSSLLDIPIGKKTAFAAEIGLTGEVRAVGRLEARVAEAQKLGFERFYLSARTPPGFEDKFSGITLRPFEKLEEVFHDLFYLGV